MKNTAIIYAGEPYNHKQVNYLLSKLDAISEHIYIYMEDALDEKLLSIKENTVIYKGKYGNRISAYKNALKSLVSATQNIDSILLCDNSFFGPFISISSMVEEMGENNIWTISKVCDYYDTNYRKIDGKIDFSFFFFGDEIRKVVSAFDAMNEDDVKNVDIAEKKLGDYLNDIGLQIETYIDFGELQSDSMLNNLDWLVELPHYMLKKGSPILKKECFKKNGLVYGNEKEILNSIQYMKDNSLYDTDIVWDYILQNYNITDIIDNLQLRYVISEDNDYQENKVFKKCAIIMHITYERVIEQCFEYIKTIPKDISVFITTKGDSCIKKIKDAINKYNLDNCEVRIACERGRDVAALLITCHDVFQRYEYVCFVHDNKTRNNLGPSIMGDNNMWDRWDNMIKTPSYINEIIKLFEKNSRLGVVIPPILHYGGAIKLIVFTWGVGYEETCKLAKRLGLNTEIPIDKYQYSVGTTFWCRTEAMKKLFEKEFVQEDFPEEPVPVDGTFSHAMERIFPYVAQDAGYYPAIVECSEYASRHIGDMNIIMREMMEKIDYPVGGYCENYINKMDTVELQNFVKNNKKICIYGNGYAAKCIINVLNKNNLDYDIQVVSDNMKVSENCTKMIHYSDMKRDYKDIGIIVALSGYNQREVVPKLYEDGYTNLFII